MQPVFVGIPVQASSLLTRLFWERLQTVMGTDIAELLLRDRKTAWLPKKSADETTEQGEEESSEVQLSFFTGSHLSLERSLKKEMERFRELLLNGRKKVSC